MNWRRGLIRLWLVLSISYAVAFIAWGLPEFLENLKAIYNLSQLDQAKLRRESENIGLPYAEIESLIDGIRYNQEKAIRKVGLYIGSVVIVPASFWILLYLGFWIVKGFKSQSE